MTKTEYKRALAKAYFIMKKVIEINIERNFVVKAMLEAQLNIFEQIPSSIFKQARVGQESCIDKRRKKRYDRKRLKGAKVITMSTEKPTFEVTCNVNNLISEIQREIQ